MARTGTHLRPAQQRLLSLVGDIEGGSIRLQHFEVHHPLLSFTALIQQASSHYTHCALMELVKLVGSANLLGTDSSSSIAVGVLHRQQVCLGLH